MKTPSKKKAGPPALHSRIRSALRAVWMRSPERHQALKRAHVTRNFYRCEAESCREVVPKVEVDHIIALGPTPGSKNDPGVATWDGFVQRLFCPPEGLQILCLTCHKSKKSS